MTQPATPGSDPNTPPAPQGDPNAQPQAPVTAPTNEPSATPPAPAPEAIGDPPANDKPDAPQEGDVYAYQATGDVGLDLALEFLGKLGFGPEHAAIVDAVDGKFDKLEAHLGALGDKATGWERYLGLVKEAHERNAAAVAQNQQQITTAVHEVAGGEAEWNAIKAWAGKTAEAAEKEAINAMLTAGPIQARAAALLLSSLYRGAGGTVVNPANPTNPNANGNPTSNGALSQAEYGREVRALRAQLGSQFDSSPEYAALQARYLTGRRG